MMTTVVDVGDPGSSLQAEYERRAAARESRVRTHYPRIGGFLLAALTEPATTNWRGRPLTSHDVIVQSIAAPTTRTGLTVHAELDTDTYPVGVKIPDAQMK